MFMNCKDKYINLKKEYSDYIILIKAGNFYYTYYDDAYIISYIFKYQIRDNRVGFPLNAKNKITSVLNKYEIGYIEVLDNSYIYNYLNNNNYFNKLDEAKKCINLNKSLEDLFKLIEIKVKENNNYLLLIKRYIDEL